jgi:hypothetical protein
VDRVRGAALARQPKSLRNFFDNIHVKQIDKKWAARSDFPEACAPGSLLALECDRTPTQSFQNTNQA